MKNILNFLSSKISKKKNRSSKTKSKLIAKILRKERKDLTHTQQVRIKIDKPSHFRAKSSKAIREEQGDNGEILAKVTREICQDHLLILLAPTHILISKYNPQVFITTHLICRLSQISTIRQILTLQSMLSKNNIKKIICLKKIQRLN